MTLETILPISEGELIRLIDTNSTLLLIDGDSVAHIACKDRWPWLQNKRGIRKGDPRWTERPPPEGCVFSEQESILYFQNCYKNFTWHLKSISEKLFSDDWLMAMKGKENYRDDMYPLYKANRKNKPHGNEFVQIVRDAAVEEGIAVSADGKEADDYLRIWATECTRLGIDYVVCREDKDLKCIVGKHWNVKKNELEVITPEYALRFYYTQLITGDPTDNIPGLPGIGPIKGEERMAHCVTEDDFQEVVVEGYMEQYGDEWQNYLLSNGKMIYIQQHWDDYFSISEWPIVKALKELEKSKKPSISAPSPIIKVPMQVSSELPSSVSGFKAPPRVKPSV
jgi:hypothetical protein